MQSVSESKQELEAAIRYAENAISSAKATIESMEFRQEMAKKTYQEQTAREYALAKREEELGAEVAQLKSLLEAEERESAVLKLKLEETKTNMALLTDEAEFYKKSYTELEVAQGRGVPTMPVSPKDVAIAIFREGIKQGVYDVCDELDNTNDIEIEESGYTGGFEVSFSKYIELSEHLDLDWIRDKVGNYEELNVINALMGLCETKGFECRIHGVDDQEEKKND